jgi:hypothetical protein
MPKKKKKKEKTAGAPEEEEDDDYPELDIRPERWVNLRVLLPIQRPPADPVPPSAVVAPDRRHTAPARGAGR